MNSLRTLLPIILALTIGLLVSSLPACVTKSPKIIVGQDSNKFPTTPFIKNLYSSTSSVLKASLFDANKRHRGGSGVVLKHTKGQPVLVLSAAHLIRHYSFRKYFVGVVTHQGKTILYHITPTKINVPHDLAILTGVEAASTSGPTARIATKQPKIGEDIWVIGWPKGKVKNVTKGIVSSYQYYSHLHRYITDAAIYYGNSGGPAFNRNGEVVGILVKTGVHRVNGKVTSVINGLGVIASLKSVRMMLKE